MFHVLGEKVASGGKSNHLRPMYLGMIGEPGSTKSLGEVELRNEKHG
jgi:hypothetical protein